MAKFFAAHQHDPRQAKTYYEKMLDDEHERYQLVEQFNGQRESPITTQFGLVDLAQKNYKSSRNRIASVVSGV
jgi:hypothetical protein